MRAGDIVAVGVAVGSITGVLVAVAMTVAVGVGSGLSVASGAVQLTIISKHVNQNIQRFLNIYLLPGMIVLLMIDIVTKMNRVFLPHRRMRSESVTKNGKRTGYLSRSDLLDEDTNYS